MSQLDFASSLQSQAAEYYENFGQAKAMGQSAPLPSLPHFFLLRTFAGENDLLVIFNTKRCRYQCNHCTLPAKSSRSLIPADQVQMQFAHVLRELKHALSIVDRITISNEGSVLDTATFPTEALMAVMSATNEMRRVRRVVLETRLEFVQAETLMEMKHAVPRASVNVLTGFETYTQELRDEVLHKREPMSTFLAGLDEIADARAELTAYVMFKPSPMMSDQEAIVECERSIDFLKAECGIRGIPLSVRINPTYLAKGSAWATAAKSYRGYQPPRLTDVMKVAEKKAREGLSVYIGLSTEGLDESGGTYHSREDYSSQLIRPIKQFNDGKIDSFEGMV